ncbi:hypothetical protein [Kutzneria sp. CA-103260]|uniref:hypothetical protein n=1 Tax=Kutzneria sp. CA-103260 TaxID=2802641 RepID=UPI001BA8CC2F|nr:hypothetical protein [Kutzneria sp. CA-103260]QUQ62326.1 hypothetical protein JJ691_00380 [Kutzneria sp. CA-103260]
MPLRWFLILLPVVIVALVGGYLWIQYGGTVVTEGRAKVRVTRVGAGEPDLLADYVSGDLTVPRKLPLSGLRIDRDQAPAGVAEGDLLDCAYLQRMAPIVNRLREPSVSDCHRVTG